MEELRFKDELLARARADVSGHAAALERLASVEEPVVAAAELLIACARSGGTLLVCGNGGSASDAQHIVAEYVGRFMYDRDPLRAIALTTNTSVLTSVANDDGFEGVFERQVRAFAGPGDVVLGLSTSGTSGNVLRAMETACACGANTIALVGPKGGPIAEVCDIAVLAPGDSTPRVQEMHILIGHIWCALVEEHACARP